MDTAAGNLKEYAQLLPPSCLFPHNDSMEMYCPSLREHRPSSDLTEDEHIEDLLNESNLRVRFDSTSSSTDYFLDSSAEYKAKLARWPAMVNLNSDVELSDAHFLKSLVPLLQQVSRHLFSTLPENPTNCTILGIK